MKKIVIGDIVSRAWDLAVKHWPIFVLLAFVNSIFTNVGMRFNQESFTSLGQNPDPQEVYRAFAESVTLSPWLIVGVLLMTYIGFITYRMLYNAITIGKPYENFVDILKIDINQFAIFFCVGLVYGLIIGIATVCCILPGIFLGVRLMFVPLLAAIENVSFAEAFRRSWQMTSGSFWDLLLLGFTTIGIAILGFCACCVGLYFAEVIINFMMVLAYMTLKIDDQPQVDSYSTDYQEIQ